MAEGRKLAIPILGLVLALTVLLCLAVGSTALDPVLVFSPGSVDNIIFLSVRLPRVVAAATAGMAFALAGVLLQAASGNSLASPNIIGVNSGAGFAVLLCMCLLPRHFLLLPVAAFAGALLATGAVFLISSLTSRLSSASSLILSGVAVNAFFNALTSTLSSLRPDLMASYSAFSIGGFAGIQTRTLVEPVILMEHLTKIYAAQPNKPALDDVNLEIYPGEFVFLVGHSGSGKTTLLSTMIRDVKPTSGRILVAGQDLMRIKNRKVPFLRRQIGAVFQDFRLLPNKTAYENVAFALECIGKPKAVIRSQVPEVLRLVGLADQMDSMPDQLSGGEQQRVAVARAMVNRPPLLICDEPTGNLDPAISLGIMKLLERINRTGTTVIVATHDREMVDSMHRRVIALEAGHIVRDQERGGYGNYGA